jgi:hypothetical protein
VPIWSGSGRLATATATATATTSATTIARAAAGQIVVGRTAGT